MTPRESDERTRRLADCELSPCVQIGIDTPIDCSGVAQDALDARAEVARLKCERDALREALAASVETIESMYDEAELLRVIEMSRQDGANSVDRYGVSFEDYPAVEAERVLRKWQAERGKP